LLLPLPLLLLLLLTTFTSVWPLTSDNVLKCRNTTSHIYTATAAVAAAAAAAAAANIHQCMASHKRQGAQVPQRHQPH
jgi:amino acid permease